MNAVDTNVFVYAFDADSPDKQSRATELLDELLDSSPQTLLLWQVAGEFLSCLRKWQNQDRVSDSDIESHLSDVMAMFPLALPTRAVIEKSVELFARYSLSHWDSMLLSACIEAGVETLYTEDLDAGTTYDSVKIVNPFA